MLLRINTYFIGKLLGQKIMYSLRALTVWFLIIFAESIHGMLRQIFLAPLVGDFPARLLAVFTAMLVIFLITYIFIRWIAAPTQKSLLSIGLIWVVLTVLFEFILGFLILGYTWERMFEDYDISRGGLMGFGLLFMFFAPYLADKLRNKINH